MPTVSIHFLPSIVAGVLAFVLGGIWYGPLFGTTWSAALGIEPDTIKPTAYGIGFVSYLVLAGCLSALLRATQVDSATGGMMVGFLVWLGAAFAIGMNTTAFTGRPLTALWIESGYQLVAFLMVGAILGAWS